MMTSNFDFLQREDYPHFYHLCSDGELTPEFITCDDDFRVAFNLVGVCAANTDVIVLSYSVEDTHLHALLYGTKAGCVEFKTMYEESWAHHVGCIRGTRKGADIELELLLIDAQDYLMNVGAYTIYQATKDGKQVMPYDYRWGTGSMYFRCKGHTSIWLTDETGQRCRPMCVGDLSERARRRLLCTRHPVPDSWRVCNGILLPENFVDVGRFEEIYKTPNCFRVFQGNNRNRDQLVLQRIALARGVAIEDAEARLKCQSLVQQMFGFKDVRRLDALQRIHVAQQLRKQYRLSCRQIAALVRIPYKEVCKYV
ncbi:MAG: hypothetical protein J5702_07870 [Bacteroidales bacterium]|nr:hypothetical protein [Bacteroidales bacterium]